MIGLWMERVLGLPPEHPLRVAGRRIRELGRHYLERAGIRLRKRELVFFECSLPATPLVPKLPEPLRIAAISRSGFETFHYLGGWLSREEALEWLSTRDCRLLGALDGADMVGNCWLELDAAQLSYFDLSAQLDGKTTYVAKLFVHPNARNKGVALNLLAAAMEQAAQEGHTRAVLCCAPRNLPILKAMQRLGCGRFQHVSYLRFLCLRRYVFRAAEGGARTVAWRPNFASRHLLHLYSRLERP